VVATLQHSINSSTLESPVHAPDPSVLTLAPGQVAGLSGLPGSGLTRIGLSLLAPHVQHGPLVYLDVRGWASPMAAWQMGIEPDQFVVVRNSDVVSWGRIVATLLDGVPGVYAEVPRGMPDRSLYKLAAKARAKRTPLVLRPTSGQLPRGIAHLNLVAHEVEWEGTEAGHGGLKNRRTILVVSGKATRGMEHTIEIEDNGTNDLRVVPNMGTQTAGQLVGRIRTG